MMMLSQTSLTGGVLLGVGVELVLGRHRVMVPAGPWCLVRNNGSATSPGVTAQLEICDVSPLDGSLLIAHGWSRFGNRSRSTLREVLSVHHRQAGPPPSARRVGAATRGLASSRRSSRRRGRIAIGTALSAAVTGFVLAAPVVSSGSEEPTPSMLL